MRIAILGAGAWGTALALAYAAAGHRIMLWCWRVAEAERLSKERENRAYLPGHPLTTGIAVTSDLSAAIEAAEWAFIATPVAGLRHCVEHLARQRPALPFLWACKGLEQDSGLLPHQVVASIHPHARCGVLTGPSFAAEVAQGLPTAITVASRDPAFTRECLVRFNLPRLRLYANDDLIGAEVGGAVKNVMAIATGICDGLALGHNARAALITRGLAEITRFGVALGARRETFMGLSGLGDLILTATGDLSRNRRVGLALARGEAIERIQRELGHVAEGVSTAFEVRRRARELGIDIPITETVCAVLEGALPAAQAVERLMNREPKAE